MSDLGFSKVLSKTRRGRKSRSDSTSNSIASTESGSSRGKIKQSLDHVADKLKGSSGPDEEEDSKGIKKLLPTRIESKRRRKQREDEQRAGEEAERGRSVADRGTLDDSLDLSTNYDFKEGDGSSLITVDSEIESTRSCKLWSLLGDTFHWHWRLQSAKLHAEAKRRIHHRFIPALLSNTTSDSSIHDHHPGRPPLSSHPSHAGYLTTSSPFVNPVILPTIVHPDGQLDGTPRASTFPPATDALAASASTDSLTSSLKAPPSDGSQKRSPSPVGRLKEAFKPRRGTSPAGSPERKSGGGVGLLPKENTTGSSRRGSVVSRIFDKQSSQPGSTNSSPERPRTGKIQPIDVNATPSTPPQSDTAPLIVNTPPTPTDTTSPRFSDNTRDRGSSDPSAANPNVVTSPSGNMISHRRVRSSSATLGPSKLSNITSAPLTPTLENGGSTTPSGTLGQGGFFSSVFSAAQNAANQLTNSIGNTSVAPNATRARSGTQELKDIIESPEVETLADKTDSNNEVEEKELAVKTLGMGDLSLSHLGISETSSGANTPVASKFPEEQRGRSEIPHNESLTNQSFATAPSATGEGFDSASMTTVVEDHQAFGQPRSMYEPSVGGDQTPPNGSIFEGKAGIQRSGSIRSAIGHRRTRGSSAATTGTTIGAAIAAAHGSVADPKAGTPKITGFAVASKKRNRDFHQLFRSVPDDDYLIEDYSCALQREILAHGRLYVSEGHLCFSSNIFGWVTTLVMSFDEIVSVEKRSTALLFKNGLMISTLHAKNVFASFTSRDSTYDLIVGIWKLGHPSLRSSLNGVRIEETGGGDKTEKDDGVVAPPESQSGSESDSDGEEGDDVYDEDDEDDDGMSFTQAEGSVAGSEIAEKVVTQSRKPSTAVATNGAPTESKEAAPAAPSIDFPGPATHAPTTCTDGETHYAKILADEIIPAPLGKVYSLMFGPASVIWMRNWLTNEQKCLELTMEGTSAAPLTSENKVRNYSYIKPLSGSIGPRQTKCISVETLDSLDLEKAVSVTISTQTPDVPNGSMFTVKTKYCISWGEGNGTRLQVNCVIEWTGKSWLKGPIEKGANDGQVQYTKDIIASLKAAVSSRRPTAAAGPTGKGKKKGRKNRESKSLAKTMDGVSDSKPAKETWGLFEPIHPILGPIFDILAPLLTSNILYGIFVGLLVATWFRFGASGKGNHDNGMGFLGTPERVAAYEEMWRREESELWEWLEDRVGMQRVRDVGKMPVEARDIKDRLREERMEEREVDAAIRVTEEKLKVLKDAVKKKKIGAVEDVD
ncbi:putative membrane protein [Lachnellula suecica]|uniref:Putative membrane protein n=1 Tax=Lachnellula suecica TaxID=602035 RepID=A0A8T9C140_9HELO|nr:putative membrane protein [Lachnellula suecica]